MKVNSAKKVRKAMPGMVMPEWYYDTKDALSEVSASTRPMTASPVILEKITDLPRLFVEYTIKEDDVLLHLFPRAGVEDKWVEGHYEPQCKNCGAVVDVSNREVKACGYCGHTGLVYTPGRSEEASALSFPENIKQLIKDAVDAMWVGDAAVELVPELGAYVVQFQRAKNTAILVGIEKFVRKACEPLNHLLVTETE